MWNFPSMIARAEDTPVRPAFDGEIWIGDVVRAWHALGAISRAERSVIAELLGFHLQMDVEPATPEVTPDPRAPERPLTRRGAHIASDVDPIHPRAPIADALTVVPLAPIMTAAGEVSGSEPAWHSEPIPLEAERPEHMAFAPVPEPLFESQWTRAIVGAICATRSQDGPIDMEALVERLARSEVVTELPRERVVTVRRGVQLLVDHGQSMMPFMRDLEALSRRIVDVVGHDRTQVWHFSASPEDGAGPGAPSTWRTPYVPPPPGTPVVLITDLGQARGAAIRDAAPRDAWLTFGAKLARSGCPAIALVPLPVDRLRTLSSAFRVVSWDRTTAVSQAQRAVAGGP